MHDITDCQVPGANMGPTWVLSAPDGPHVGHTNLAIRDTANLYFLGNGYDYDHVSGTDKVDGLCVDCQIMFSNVPV